MCGIAGFIAPENPSGPRDALGKVMTRLRHRGPDDEGICIPPGQRWPGAVGLANCRLAILDLSPGGHQPMVSVNGRWTLAFNGEIYNYRELRGELEGLGRQFRSHSDTEVLMQAFDEWGTAVLPRLSGMFAFAIYDREAERVTLARDPFGIKPLYYSRQETSLVFASEIPAVIEFPGLSRAVDFRRYHEFLVSGNSDYGDGTLLADVRQLPAGHFLEVPVSSPRSGVPTRYWQPDLSLELDCSFDQAAELVREAFLESMRLHLRSDVPLGFALSGGIDSSAVVMAARALLGKGTELHTFSFIPDDPRINEERHVDTVVRAADATGHKLRLTPDDLVRDIEHLAAIQGEPFASPVIYAQYRIFGLAREHGLKVVLGGEGADETLAGYDRYLPARLASLLRQGRLTGIARALHRPAVPIRGGRFRTLRSAISLALPPFLGLPARDIWSRQRGNNDWLDEQWFEERGVRAEPAWTPRSRRVLREMLDHNLRQSQVQALVRYQDRSAMAFSLENRVPFLSPRLVELLFSLPEEYLLAPDGTRKAVFRHAMRGLVPNQILDRRDKIGFSVPTVDWFNALRPWIAGRLDHVAELGGLKRTALQRRWREFSSAQRPMNPVLIWRCVSLSVWAERFGVKFN
jgi:asparagine synthase (glutamine-hydrolysing)